MTRLLMHWRPSISGRLFLALLGLGLRGRGTEHVRPQLLARDGAAGGLLDGDAAFDGNFPFVPLSDRRRFDAQRIGKLLLGADDADCFGKCGGVVHGADLRINLFLRQQGKPNRLAGSI